MKRFLTYILIGFCFPAYSQMSLLLVNDNDYSPGRVERIKEAIISSGYTFGFYDAAAAGEGPSFELLSNFDLVIWYTGNDGAGLWFWNGNETVNQNITEYIDNGGMLWVQGLDFLYDRHPLTPVFFFDGDFEKDYLGILSYYAQSYTDDGYQGVHQLDLVYGNGIFTLDPLLWTYNTMWYVDALLPASGATPVYEMGPSNYILSGYFPAVYNEKGNGKVLSFAFETARINTQNNTNQLIGEGLQYFDQFAGGTNVYMDSMKVYSASGVNAITENGGSLQLEVDIFPGNVTIPYVFWSISGGTAVAGIDQNGLLQSSGMSNGNGTVWVKACALDGSGVADSVLIEISNQGGGFEILLVNDNANGTDRYLVLDTTLTNLGCSYQIYNTVETGDFPSYDLLSDFDLVIWYTGNDGVDLKLWNTDNPNDYQFNEPLKQYLDAGGIVWLQGLDFFYDIFGQAPVFFNQGQFIYDYLGIASYYAQSYSDDGGQGVAEMDIVEGNPVCSFSPVEWVYPTLWYADALEIQPQAQGVYKMGPPGYIFDDYFSGVYNIRENSKILTFTFETARIDTREHTEELYSQVISFFEQTTSQKEYEKCSGLKLSPNPASKYVTITLPGNKQSGLFISLFDISGKCVLRKYSVVKQSFTLSLTGIPAGIYFYNVLTDNKPFSGKLIIE